MQSIDRILEFELFTLAGRIVNGVVIAFPQLDLHLDAPVVKALHQRDGS